MKQSNIDKFVERFKKYRDSWFMPTVNDCCYFVTKGSYLSLLTKKHNDEDNSDTYMYLPIWGLLPELSNNKLHFKLNYDIFLNEEEAKKFLHTSTVKDGELISRGTVDNTGFIDLQSIDDVVLYNTVEDPEGILADETKTQHDCLTELFNLE